MNNLDTKNSVSNINIDVKNGNINILGKKETKIKTEYLFLLKEEDGFFETDENIKNIFYINNNIKFSNAKIEYKGIEISYKLTSEYLKTNSSEKYVHLMFEVLILDKDDQTFIKYNEFLRIVKKIIAKWDPKNEVLWDGVGYYYAIQSYPLIYKIENLIRKLITKFMLKNLGRDWTKKYISQDIKKTVRQDDKVEDKGNFLHNIDFKQLEIFLFEKFSNEDKDTLYKKISEGNCNMDELKKYLPESNWNRLFSNLITEVKETELRKTLSEIYQLRCKVAHNNIITTKDFEDINKHYKFLKPQLEMAISKIDEIKESEIEEMVAVSLEKLLSVSVAKDIFSENNNGNELLEITNKFLGNNGNELLEITNKLLENSDEN